ncbi:MAG: PAS domain-containing sensor histidine kinase, partial [Candidatus Margulisiibacteriota bacterium]
VTPQASKKVTYVIYGIYFSILVITVGLFCVPSLSSYMLSYLFKTNYAILAVDLIYLLLASIFFVWSGGHFRSFLSLSVLSLFLANAFHASTIPFPWLIRYLVVYNLLMILSYLLIEIFIFYEIIRELRNATVQVEGLNNELEEKIKGRTQELYTSNKELFHANYMLHQEKEKLNTIIENLEEGIIVSNISHTILMMNTSAKNILGIEKSPIGNLLRDLIPDKAYMQDINNVILKKVRFISKEISLVNQDKQTLHIFMRSSLSSDSKGNVIGVITLFRDITKEKEIEQLKSGFLRTISHELKTPLTTIIGFSETLSSERRGKLNEDQQNYIGIILKESLQLNRLINDILEFSILTSNKISLSIEDISLKALVSEILDSFRPQAVLKNIEILFDSDINLPTIQADREKLHKVFLNLINNAIHYTQKGHIQVAFSTEKNKIVTKISDTGIGIAPSDLDRIFEKFIQLDYDTKNGYRSGLGLGLSIARDLILLHDGRIWAESTVGEGSTFYIELPISR